MKTLSWTRCDFSFVHIDAEVGGRNDTPIFDIFTCAFYGFHMSMLQPLVGPNSAPLEG
jgi:hypothetical protein